MIQRFETCYDCLWKVLKRYLSEGLGLPDIPNSPRPIFRLAHENDLFDSPLERWLQYAEARIDTSHDYDVPDSFRKQIRADHVVLRRPRVPTTVSAGRDGT